MSTIPSIQQIVSQYLWGQKNMPAPSELVDSKWIRDENYSTINIDQYEYMTLGAGRYATVDMFGIFNKFFDAKIIDLPAKNYSFTELVDILYSSYPESERPTENSSLGLSQYQMDIHSADYAQRAYIFGSTSFTANWSEMSFIVNENGSKEIRNLQIIAEKDNFDYKSDSGVAIITNTLTEEKIDRSGTGRTVDLVFTGEAPIISSLTSADFYALKNKNETIRENYYDRMDDNLGLGNIDLSQISMFIDVINDILDSGITKPKDIHGNDIFYVNSKESLDLKLPINVFGDLVLVGNNANNTLEGQGGNNYIYGFAGVDTLKGGFGNDHLFGGKGTDTLYGGHGNDYLYANALDNFNDSGSNALYGGQGSDYLYGGSESDYLYAGDKINDTDDTDNNYIFGREGNDYIFGAAGNDYLYGGAGNDELLGEDGDDFLDGGNLSDSDKLYGGAGQDTLRGAGRLEGGTGFDIYNSYGKVVVNDEDGLGILKYHEKNILGAEMRYKSNTLSPPPALDFSKSGYDINDKSTGRLVEIARTEKYVRYIVTGDINFKYGNLTTEDLDTRSKDDSDLGIKFYVTVYKDIPPPPPPFLPPKIPPTKYDPLVLDLNHDGKISTTPLGKDIYFDLDGNGFAEKTSWVGPHDGFVVLDLNENNEIDSGKELFGTDTVLPDGSKASDGFQALAQYDLNNDQEINSDDAIYKKLKIWRDINQDGISQTNELISLADLNVYSINLKNKVVNNTDENNVIHTNQGGFTQSVLENGEIILKDGLAETLLFEVNTSETIWKNPTDGTSVSNEILKLPDLLGYGSATSLHVAMQNDLTGVLKNLVLNFAETSADHQLLLAYKILYFWTNNKITQVSDINSISNKEKFEIVKVLYGKELEWKNWIPSNVNDLEGYFQKILSNTYIQLLSQTTKRDWIDLIVFDTENIFEAATYLHIDAPKNATGKPTFVTFEDEAPLGWVFPNIEVYSWNLIDQIWHGDFSLAIERLTELFLNDNQLGKIEIEQFHLIVRGLDPNHDVLYKELLEQFSLKAQEITDETIKDLLLDSVYAQDDILQGTNQNDVIKSFGGNDRIETLGGDDIAYGGIGQDIIYGGTGNDYLEGNQGDDRIYGGDGSDTLIGGTGNDYLDGGAGNDTYIFSLGDGQDTIQSYENNANKLDRIVFNDGIEIADVSLKRQGDDLIVKYSENDQITVNNYFDNNGATAYRIDQIVFADGTVWDVDYIKQKLLVPTQSNDTIQGYNSADQLSGLAGNDSLFGNSGNDTLIGGTGNDYLDGGAGNDTYIFSLGDGQDTIQSYEYNINKLDRIVFSEGIVVSDVSLKRQGDDLIVKYSEQDQITVKNYFDSNGATASRIDQIVFADGTVWDVAYIKQQVLVPTESNDTIQGYNSADQLSGFAGNDSLFGNSGNDTLIGGTGNDYLDGGAGNDTYIFSLGDGQDTIQSSENNANKLDRIVFNDGIVVSDVSLKRQGDDLIVKYSEQDQITVKNYFDSNGATASRIDQIVFADETVWDVETIKIKVLAATESNDVINGYNSSDELNGLAGNDILYGHAGNDTLIGGTGNDHLEGGTGNDTYIFAPNFGHDIISNYDAAHNRQDVIQFTDGLIQSDFIFRRINDDLVIRSLNGENSITVQNYFEADALGYYRIDKIHFSDNTTLDVEAVKALVLLGTAEADILKAYATGSTIAGEDGDDRIHGNTGSDQLYGGSGLDKLYGGDGNDFLNGGTDSDYLDGGLGNDTYIFARNFGHDTIYNYDSAKNRQDIIHFTDGLTQSDFTFRRNNDDLVIRSLNGENSITVQNYFDSDGLGNYRIDQIQFSDNTRLDIETIKSLVLLGTAEADTLTAYVTGGSISGEAGDDVIYGNSGSDQLYGGEGIDKLYGGEGDDRLDGETGDDQLYGDRGHDILIGGSGNDQIYGGQGNDILSGGTGQDTLVGDIGDDTYIFERSFGHDTIYNYDSAQNRQDIIQFTDGLIQSDFTFRRNNNDLVIRTLNDENSITVQHYFEADASGYYRIDKIHFSDNTTLDVEAVKALVLLGTAEADTLTAYATGSTISGEAGDDVIYGNVGSDQLYGGEGIDKLYGGHGDDHLEGGSDDDQLYGGLGNDTLISDAGNDLLEGGEGDDLLNGGIDQDKLIGGTGDDVLIGGSGNDYLEGSAGNDTYIFAPNFGHDIISNYDSAHNRQDVIQFTDGLTQSDFIFRRNNDDLVIRSLNGENSVTVQNYFESDASGYYRIDKIHFSDNTTLDVEAVKALVLLGTAEADILKAYATGSTIAGEAGDDVIHGHTGSDQLYGGEGLDQLYGGSGDDHLDGGAEDDQLYAGNGNDVLIGGSGNDLLDAGEGADQLYGGTSNDVLNGGAGNDFLDGGDGSDQLNGGTGDDILVGGTGDDVLIGGQGNDIYRFDLGWGQDIIQYESKNQTDIDTIEFININPDDLIIRKTGQDMIIVHRATGDQLIVESQFSDYLSNKPINKVRFDDQTEWDEAALNIQAVKGTELDDIIEGTTDHDVIHASDGDDIVYGRSVYSETPETQYFVYGGAGNDKIYATGYLDGGVGDDEIEGAGHLLGGEGNDILSGQGVLEGQSGNDILTGQGKLYGGDGQDQLTLTGLVNNELGLLSGGAGDDVLTIDVNQMDFVNEYNQDQFYQDVDGYHRIQDTELSEVQRAIYVEGGQGDDTIYGSFGDEVYLFNLGDGQDTIIERPAGQNYTNVAVSFDVLRFGQNILTTDISLHRYGTDLVIKHSNQIDQITIQNYFVGGHHKINEIQFADSTTWDNSYIENHVTYHGTTNNDEVWGYRDTHETFEMGDGDDKVYSGAGNDIIYGQAGNDILWGQAGNDTLYGGTDADYLEGNEGDDILHGDQGNDILYGGDGNDILYGGDGDDTLRGGAGHDILNGGIGNDKYFYYLTEGQKTIDQTGGGTDVLWLMDQGITEDRIKFTKENNDLIVTIDNNINQSVRVKDHFLGGEKAISSVQPNGGYTITAAQIAIKVNASSGGSSDPVGDTIYQYTSGAMTITEQSGNDTVLFKNGITFSQVGNYLTKSGDDLILKVNGSNSNTVTIKNFFKAGQYLVETLQFETGGQLTAEQIFGAFGLTIPSETTPTPPNPVGDTTYTYSSGELTITEQSGNDKVIFKNGITFNQIGNYLNKSGDDLVLKINGSNTNKVTVKNFFLAGNYLVENFEIETGGALSAAQIFSAFGLTLPSTDGGNQGSSEVAGDTVYNYTTGALTITEHSGNDKVIFKNGITFNQVGSYLTKSGDDLILKVNGSNTNKVTVKNFFLAGQYLVETFQFETGGQITAEQIFGAFGITMPQQSAPANTPPENTDLDAFNTSYNYSSGAMVIDEKLGTDQVVFGNGITFSQVGNYLTKSGDDLILKVNGSNSNKVTVKDFFLGGAHEVESFNFETGGSISSQQIYQVFGVDRPVNAEDEVTSIVMSDSGDNVLSSDATVSELFILNEGNDILELLLNASGETAVDYVSNFNVAEDQIDLSQILDSQATNTNLSDYIEIIYDASAKTNTLSVRNPSAEISKDLLIFTNQAESLSIADLTLNQAIIY